MLLECLQNTWDKDCLDDWRRKSTATELRHALPAVSSYLGHTPDGAIWVNTPITKNMGIYLDSAAQSIHALCRRCHIRVLWMIKDRQTLHIVIWKHRSRLEEGAGQDLGNDKVRDKSSLATKRSQCFRLGFLRRWSAHDHRLRPPVAVHAWWGSLVKPCYIRSISETNGTKGVLE
jgi:hypothetical protein